MIWQPKPGQRVRIRYRCGIAEQMPHHNCAGTVIRAGRGPGSINAEVRLDSDAVGGEWLSVIVPRGNLFAEGNP